MSQRSLMALPFPTFKSLVHSTLRVFERWDENVKEFVSVCREMARKRSEKVYCFSRQLLIVTSLSLSKSSLRILLSKNESRTFSILEPSMSN